MKTSTQIEPNLDRFEGEGGALAGPTETARQQQRSEGVSPRSPMKESSWRVRPEFTSSLEGILAERDVRDEKAAKERNELSDQDEEFTQNFTELLNAQILPQLENAAALLARRFYPAEVRVTGDPSARVCYLAFANKRKASNWAFRNEKIEGPRMMFAADTATHRVAYTVSSLNGVRSKAVSMKISEVTDAFIEEELRQLFREDHGSPTPRFSGARTFLRAVSRACS